MRSSSVIAFRAPRQRCSPGESGVADLAAAAAPPRTSRASAGVRSVRRGGRGGARAGEIAEQRLTAPRRRRLDTRLVESAT